jgi:AcrR family transcriptional regulator
MGRPRDHDERTAERLLDAAEKIVEAAGLDSLSVRGVACETGTTTRAVYSLYGSKDGLVVALGKRAFELLGSAIRDLAQTPDPADDLVQAGLVVFRRFAVAHPALFGIGFRQLLKPPRLGAGFRDAAADSYAGLKERVARLGPAGLGGRSVEDAAVEFHALCEGLAALELRGLLPDGREEDVWHSALGALVRGFSLRPV